MNDRLFKCLVESNRRKILYCIGRESKCVDTISRCLGLEQSLVSHHLKKLHDCGLVKKERRGKKIYYQISSYEIIDLLQSASKLGDELEAC
ncbi:MAG: ArsR/SmtB family transcription factor [Thermoplasmatota archaeon]